MRILELLGTGTVGTSEATSASTVLAELANALVRSGHEITLVDLPASGPRTRLDERVSVVEVKVPCPHPVADPPAPRFPRLARRLNRSQRFTNGREMFRHWRYLRAALGAVPLSDFDVIHVHHGKQAYPLNKLHKLPYVYTSHWAFKNDDRGFDAEIERKIVDAATLAVGLGSYLGEFCPRANTTIIPHGIHLDSWEPVDKAEARRALNIGDDEFVLTYVGFVDHHKGPDLLVEATRQLHPQIDKLKVFLVGSTGPDRSNNSPTSKFAQALMETAADLPVEFTGPVDYQSLRHRELLAAADLLVLPSRHEAQGMVALEAVAMGTPVVASKVGGLGEMITPDIGRLVPVGDAGALAETILALQADPGERHRMAANCRPHAADHCGWDAAARRYVEAFEAHREQLKPA